MALCLAGVIVLAPLDLSHPDHGWFTIALADSDGDGGGDSDGDGGGGGAGSGGSSAGAGSGNGGGDAGGGSFYNPFSANRHAIKPYNILRRKVLNKVRGRIVGIRHIKSNHGLIYKFRIIDKRSRLVDVFINARTGRITRLRGK